MLPALLSCATVRLSCVSPAASRGWAGKRRWSKQAAKPSNDADWTLRALWTRELKRRAESAWLTNYRIVVVAVERARWRGGRVWVGKDAGARHTCINLPGLADPMVYLHTAHRNSRPSGARLLFSRGGVCVCFDGGHDSANTTIVRSRPSGVSSSSAGAAATKGQSRRRRTPPQRRAEKTPLGAVRVALRPTLSRSWRAIITKSSSSRKKAAHQQQQ